MENSGVLLLALLTAVPGREADFLAYEAEVLPLLGKHGGLLKQRLRMTEDAEGSPTEAHLIWFPDEAALDAYRADPARAAAASRYEVPPIAQAQVLRVESI